MIFSCHSNCFYLAGFLRPSFWINFFRTQRNDHGVAQPRLEPLPRRFSANHIRAPIFWQRMPNTKNQFPRQNPPDLDLKY